MVFEVATCFPPAVHFSFFRREAFSEKIKNLSSRFERVLAEKDGARPCNSAALGCRCAAGPYVLVIPGGA